MINREIVISGAARTPIGKYLGTLRDIPAYELAALVLEAAIERSHIESAKVDDVIMGQAYQIGTYRLQRHQIKSKMLGFHL